MAKGTGLQEALYVGGHDLSGEVQQWSLGGSLPVQDVTTIRQAAMDRRGLIPDGTLSHDTILDTDPDHAHEYLSTLPSGNELITLVLQEVLAGHAGSFHGLQINYDPTRASDASLLVKTESQASKGSFWDWGNLLTPGKRTDAVATNGASVDGLAASAFGMQAYLHVFAFDGDDCTITIQSSSDNGAGDAFAAFTGSAFTEVTVAPFTERITTARDAALERYLRVVTSGTFTSITFAVVLVRNPVEVLL